MITILTPTYNRAHTLQRLFDSLLSQDDMSFEWIIIDDGSIDDTKDLVECFIEESPFDIHYFYQNNMGKPTAINRGVVEASKHYILIVDSDDVITGDCIRILSNEIKSHLSDSHEFSGLCFRKGNLDGSVLGEEIIDVNLQSKLYHSTDIQNLFKVDMAYCFKKSYMKKNFFPKIIGEKFVPELYIWNRITDLDLVYTYMNKIIYLCEYMPDGLSANFRSQLKKNPKGFLLYYKDQVRREVSLLKKLKNSIRIIQCQFYKYI